MKTAAEIVQKIISPLTDDPRIIASALSVMEEYADQFKNTWMPIDEYKKVLKNGDQVDLLCSDGERMIDMHSYMGEYGGAIFETTYEVSIPEVDVTHVMYSPKHPNNKA